MNRKQIKKYLIDKDLTVAEIARNLANRSDVTASETSLQQMLSDMFNERRWYPTLATIVEQEYSGLRLTRWEQFTPRVRLKAT